MISDTLNPNANVTIGLEGLAVVCLNESHNENRGRWEIAIPRFDDHKLTIKVSDLFTMVVEKDVKMIEIKDREGVATKPKHEVGAFDRKQRDKNDKNDYRWIRTLTNGGAAPVPITKEENESRVDVTMLYVYDAVAYTKDIEPDTITLIHAEQANTVPVIDGNLEPPVPGAEAKLSLSEDVGSEARTLGMDIQSPRGGAVDIIFDGLVATTIPQRANPQQLLIRNTEVPGVTDDDRFLNTDQFEFALGDFYRYYQLFKVAEPELHAWGRVPSGDRSNKNCCCNKVTVDLPNLDALR